MLTSGHAYSSATIMNTEKEMGAGAPNVLLVLLFVTVLTKPFLALVRGHFMTLTLLSAWHSVSLRYRVKR